MEYRQQCAKRCSVLTSLEVASYATEHSIGGRQVLERICDGVSRSSTLVSLKMSSMLDIRPPTPIVLLLVSPCVPKNLTSMLPNLQSDCCLGDLDIARLASALSSNTSLRNLSLASNPFGKVCRHEEELYPVACRHAVAVGALLTPRLFLIVGCSPDTVISRVC